MGERHASSSLEAQPASFGRQKGAIVYGYPLLLLTVSYDIQSLFNLCHYHRVSTTTKKTAAAAVRWKAEETWQEAEREVCEHQRD